MESDQHYLFGEKIREIRKAKNITINQISKETGLTASFISQFERGKTEASVASIQKIAKALGVSVSSLFNNKSEIEPTDGDYPVIIRKERRKKLTYPDHKNIIDYLLTGHGGHLELIYSEIEPGGESGEQYSHNSEEECILVLKGELEVTIQDKKYVLLKGDTITFCSRDPHGWRNIGKEKLEILFIVTPPSF